MNVSSGNGQPNLVDEQMRALRDGTLEQEVEKRLRRRMRRDWEVLGEGSRPADSWAWLLTTSRLRIAAVLGIAIVLTASTVVTIVPTPTLPAA